MSETTELIRAGSLDGRILFLRGLRVMLDADLADVYGVTTSQLNQQVRRNLDRFPADFMFQLFPEEKGEVITICDHLRKLKYSPTRPYAFTEHGALMLASVLNSATAVAASIQIVRAFIRLREAIGAHRDLARKLDVLERKYDGQFQAVFEALRQLMAPPTEKRRKIGFRGGEGVKRATAPGTAGRKRRMASRPARRRDSCRRGSVRARISRRRRRR
jgi:hypothetical protein